MYIHTVVSITRARRSEINETQAQKKKEVSRRKKEEKKRERRKDGRYKNVEVAPRCSRRGRFSRSRSTNVNCPRPTRFHGFQFCRRWSPSATFFPQPFFNPSFSPLPSLGPYLIRGSLIRTRGREWAAKDPFLSLFAASPRLDPFPS